MCEMPYVPIKHSLNINVFFLSKLSPHSCLLVLLRTGGTLLPRLKKYGLKYTALENYWQIYWASYWNSTSKRFTGKFTAHITGKKDYCPVTGVPVTTKHVTGVAVRTKREHQSIVSLASSSAEHQNAGSFGRCSHTPLASAQHGEG
jgi:hypothetical protein